MGCRNILLGESFFPSLETRSDHFNALLSFPPFEGHRRAIIYHYLHMTRYHHRMNFFPFSSDKENVGACRSLFRYQPPSTGGRNRYFGRETYDIKSEVHDARLQSNRFQLCRHKAPCTRSTSFLIVLCHVFKNIITLKPEPRR